VPQAAPSGTSVSNFSVAQIRAVTAKKKQWLIAPVEPEPSGAIGLRLGLIALSVLLSGMKGP